MGKASDPVLKSSHWSALKPLLFVLLPVFVLMIVVLGFAKLNDVPVTNLLRDPNAVLDGAFYVGLFSTAGIALWAAAAAMCLLLLSAGVDEQPRTLLTAGAVVSLIAMADDAYLLHESLPVLDLVVFSLYGFVAVVLFWRAWRYLIGRPNVSVFVASLGLLALSLMIDIEVFTVPGSRIIEDIAKFLGIVAWVMFFGGFCRDLIIAREITSAKES